MKWVLKGGISIDTDSGPLGYVLWCCGSRGQDFFIFIQFGSGHTVTRRLRFKTIFRIKWDRRHWKWPTCGTYVGCFHFFYQKNCFQGVGEGRGQLLWLLARGSISKKRKLHVQVQSRCSAPANPPLPFFCTVDIVHINVWRGIARVCSGLIFSLDTLQLYSVVSIKGTGCNKRTGWSKNFI